VSNALAIATVTATLRQLLQPAIQRTVTGAQVRTLRPDLIAADRSGSGVNLFLYEAYPDADFRNDDLPTRRADGAPIRKPRAALGLTYLISCFGSDDALEPQRLLGATAATLHAWPVLSRSDIASAIAAEPDILGGSDLAEQPELVRMSMLRLGTEELSRLWSMFSPLPYHLSVAYQASVVLIDEDLVPLVVLPVQQVHPTVIATDDPAATLASLAGTTGP
jgi:uncharacterized protein DUF4255